MWYLWWVGLILNVSKGVPDSGQLKGCRSNGCETCYDVSRLTFS